MSINEIENKIIEQSLAEAQQIKARTEAGLEKLKKEHALKAAAERENLLRQAARQAEDLRRSILVPARLGIRRRLLEEKQNILTRLYQEIKREEKLSDAELVRLREASEISAAQILFEA